jgi:hypothetical protein
MADRDTVPVSQAVSRATALVDPDGTDSEVEGLLLAYEDDDRPARGLPGLHEELRSTVEGMDPDEDSPAVRVAAALAFFYAGRPEAEHAAEDVVPSAVRLFYGDDGIPDFVRAWLEAAGEQV